MKNPKLKKAFEKGYKELLFSELMISITEGDDISTRNLAKELSNKVTIKTFSDTDRNMSLKRYKSAKDMFDDLEI